MTLLLEPEHWRAHRWGAFALRASIVLVPVLAATAMGLLAGELLGQPEGVTSWIVWTVVVVGVGLVGGIAFERLALRFVPLAILARLSLIFPDQAPSRFGLALRASSSARLAAWQEGRGAPTEPASDGHHADEILALTLALHEHDRRTRGHSERVRALTDLVAQELKLDAATRERLQWAALLHDIGKLSVPAAVLNKPGKPDDEELALLQAHPDEGVALAGPLLEWLGDAGRAIGDHHERWDGTGYPQGLAGKEISLGGRIVALTDAFDTMTSVRSYKKAMTIRAAREEVARCAGSHFDPAVARAFLDISLPRLWLVVGPASFVAQLPFVGLALRGALSTGSVSSLAAAGTGAMASIAAVAISVTLVASPTPGDSQTPDPDPVPPPTLTVDGPPEAPSASPTPTPAETANPGSSVTPPPVVVDLPIPSVTLPDLPPTPELVPQVLSGAETTIRRLLEDPPGSLPLTPSLP